MATRRYVNHFCNMVLKGPIEMTKIIGSIINSSKHLMEYAVDIALIATEIKILEKTQ